MCWPIALVFGARAAGAAGCRTEHYAEIGFWMTAGRTRGRVAAAIGAVGVRSIWPRHPSDWPTDRANWFITPSAISASTGWPAFSLSQSVARNYFRRPQAHIAHSLAHYSFDYALTSALSISSIHSPAGRKLICFFLLHKPSIACQFVSVKFELLWILDVICARRHQCIILCGVFSAVFLPCIYLLAMML